MRVAVSLSRAVRDSMNLSDVLEVVEVVRSVGCRFWIDAAYEDEVLDLAA